MINPEERIQEFAYCIPPSEKGKFYLCFSHALSVLDADRLELLSEEELKLYKTYRYPKRKSTFLLGRYCAKNAIRNLVGDCNFSAFSIIPGTFHEPLIRGLVQCGVTVSISHSDQMAAAIACFDTFPSGIDVEYPNPENLDTLRSVISKAELDKAKDLELSEDILLTLLWCARESLSKTLKTGLLVDSALFETASFFRESSFIHVYYRYFPQFSSIVFIWNGMIVSITKPKKAIIQWV